MHLRLFTRSAVEGFGGSIQRVQGREELYFDSVRHSGFCPPFPASCACRSTMAHRGLRRVGRWRGPGFE
jgi:hypothetical protein